MTCSISLPLEVREAVLRQLKDINGKITDGRMWLYEMGAIDLDLDRSCMHGHTYARYILTWHIATSICDYDYDNMDLSCMDDPSREELMKNHGIATKLSGYCAYLLAFQPDLVPDSTYTSLSLAHDTL